jgi:hypothetical protein
MNLVQYSSHLLAKGLIPAKVRIVLLHIEANSKKWCRGMPDIKLKVLAREAVDALVDEGLLPNASVMCVSVRSLMLLGLRADAAFYLMCAITQVCGGDGDYMYHYAAWDWLEDYLQHPVNGPGIFGAELHNRIN